MKLLVHADSSRPLVPQDLHFVPSSIIQTTIGGSQFYSAGSQVNVLIQVTLHHFHGEKIALEVERVGF